MIFYGTKGKHINSKRVSGIKCTYCNEQSSHTVTIFGRYFYIYWIPIFPIGKKGVSECDHCKVTYEPKDMSNQLKMAFNNVKGDSKTPITYWTGTLVIAVFILIGAYSAAQHSKNIVHFIAQPKVGDIIDYKSSVSNYSTLKITKITTDSVYVVANSMEISRKSKLYKIDKEDNYTAERYAISINDYKNSFEDKTFLDVDRD